jgi:hypothetical protein
LDRAAGFNVRAETVADKPMFRALGGALLDRFAIEGIA